METNHLPSSKSQVNQEYFWLEHIKQRNQTSLSKNAYCKQHGLIYSRYLYWNQKLSSRSNEPIKLVPVQIAAPQVNLEPKSPNNQFSHTTKLSALCSVTLATGAVLQIYDPAALNTLIEILR
jgi:hypothetical protein